MNTNALSKAKPLIKDLYGDYKVDYNLNKCSEKNTLFNLLKNHTPKYVDKIDTKGSYWHIWDVSTYCFNINKSAIVISDMTANIADFYEFLEQLVYYDDRPLYAVFDDEGSYMVITAIPVDDKKIRFTIYPYNYNDNKRIEEDIIIDKYVFIKQITDVIKRCLRILELDNDTHSRTKYTIKTSNRALEFLNDYLKNPENFKKTYKIPYHIRLFDIAYKKPDSDWEFTYCFEEDDKCASSYWEEQIKLGKIEKYDIQEQMILMNQPFYHYVNDEPQVRHYIKKEDIIFEPDMDERENWSGWHRCRYNNKWYSKYEIPPKPHIKQTTLEDFKLNIQVSTEFYSKWRNYETYTDNKSSWKKYVDFILTIKKDDFKSEYSFHYDILTEKFLSKLECGKDIKLEHNSDYAYLWNDEQDYFSFYYNYEDKKYFLKIRKDEFISKFKAELKRIDKEIEDYKINRQKLRKEFINLDYTDEEFNDKFESLIYSRDDDIFNSTEFKNDLIKRIEEKRADERNSKWLYEFNVMYKTPDNKCVVAVDFDEIKLGTNLKKKWHNKVNNGEILDFECHLFLDKHKVMLDEIEKYKPTHSMWFSRGWVVDGNGNWYSKDEIMPEPNYKSKLVNSINDFSFEVNYLEKLEEYRLLLKKISKGKNFHTFINPIYKPTQIFHVWNRADGLIRIRLEKYEMDYRRTVTPDVVDITIKKDVFIKEFKQMLDEVSRY